MKKPFSHPTILAYFRDRGVVERPDEIAVVGDRLGTDVLMASLMGAWSVWVRDGVTVGVAEDGDVVKDQVVDYRGWLAKGEAALERYLRRRGVKPAMPSGWEDTDK
jgi:phosphatidylglycerophosphatase GEP4